MSQYAKDKYGNLVFANQAVKNHLYHCPECGRPVKIKKGFYRNPYFSHIPTLSTNKGKSLLHQKMQQDIIASLPKNEGETEKCFPSLQRIADVVWEKQKILFEIQCSPISEEELLQRNRDYQSYHYNIIWILHYPTFKPPSKLSPLFLTNPFYFFEKSPTIFDLYIPPSSQKKQKPIQYPIQIHLPLISSQNNSLSYPQWLEKRLLSWKIHFTGDFLHHFHTSPNTKILPFLKENTVLKKVRKKKSYFLAIRKKILSYFFSFLHYFVKKNSR